MSDKWKIKIRTLLLAILVTYGSGHKFFIILVTFTDIYCEYSTYSLDTFFVKRNFVLLDYGVFFVIPVLPVILQYYILQYYTIMLYIIE